MKRLFVLILTFMCIGIHPLSVTAAEDYASAVFESVKPETVNMGSVLGGRNIERLITNENIDGVPCVRMHTKDLDGSAVNGSWLIFDITASSMTRMKDGSGVDITIEYFDEGDGTFCIVYDARAERKKPSEKVLLNGTNTWKTHTFHLYDAYFGNRCESKDFLLTLWDNSIDYSTSDLVFKSVTVKKSGKIFPINLTENITRTGNLYEKGETPIISLDAANILADAVAADYKCTITDSKGDVKAEICDTVTFESGKNTLNIDTGITLCDAYDVKIVFNDDSNLYGEFKTNFGISVVAEQNSDYATNTHYRISSRTPALSMPFAKNSGSSMIRDGIRWAACVNSSGEFSMPDYYMNYIDEARANNLDVCILLGLEHPSYDNGGFPQCDAAVKAFGDYVYNTVSALKGKADTFEVWNEFHHTAYKQGMTDDTNRSNPPSEVAAAYVKLLKTAYTRAKEANPDCTIVGLGGLPGVWDKWVEKVLAAGAGDYMDVMSLHEYDEYGAPEERMIGWLENVNEHIKKYNCTDIPIWVTETGWSTSWNISQDEETKYSFGIRQYVLYKEFGIKKYFWYDLKSDGVNSRDYQDNFGTIWFHTDREHIPYSARTSYIAFANMNDKLGNSEIISHTTDANGTELYCFENKDGEKTYVLWNKDKKTNADVSLDPSKPWKVYDVFGNDESVHIKADGTCTAAVSSVPIYISASDSLPNTGVTCINYATGDISVRISGFESGKKFGVLVTKPQKDISDIENEKLGALAYMAQPDDSAGVFDFTFTADEEGVYTIYANTGGEIIKLGAAYYKPVGLNVSFGQGGETINDFSKLDKSRPVTVNAVIDNSYGADSEYVLVCAEYKGDVLVDIVTKTGRISADDSEQRISAEISATPNGFDKIKVYLWKDMTRLVPFTDTIEWN